MDSFTRRVLFFLFFVSGFCSLVYQVVWTRLAFASFGIITPVLSVVLSVFMLGLAIGSWAGGRFIGPLAKKTGLSAAYFYGAAELLIGLGAFAVPRLFVIGERILLTSGETDSLRYLSLSALVLAVSILPWCICMGATFPLMMAYVRERQSDQTNGFSFLYLANVLGAMSGTFLTAVVFIELWGFHHTLWQAAVGNFSVAFISVCLGRGQRSAAIPAETQPIPAEYCRPQLPAGRFTKAILFSTGFVAMAMEVVWTRAFTPVLKTQVYSFALIVFTYLGATFLGSWAYRVDLRKNRVKPLRTLIAALAVTALLPVVANDSRVLLALYWMPSPDPRSALLLLASICPFCAVLGYLTPRLIDGYAAGRPSDAGKVYAINVLGCILGPLCACYLLLPRFSERHALILLATPFVVFWLLFLKSQTRRQFSLTGLAISAVLVWALVFTEDYETMLFKTMKNTTIRRDYAASVISFVDGPDKELLVNGIGMTKLSPVTKFMAHLPLAFHEGRPKTALIICFGMGTTFRSAMSWDIDTTVVELVPGVTKAFGFYHTDAARWANNPKGHIVIDDGRRYLNRSGRKFDVIVIDPPPPIETAGSSLLLSREFYALARKHLNPGGILQMWYPGGERPTTLAVLQSINESFPYVYGFISVEGWGVHLIASEKPVAPLNAAQLAARMPESARKDLMEWYSSTNTAAALNIVLTNGSPVASLVRLNPNIRITDDQPFNEYFLLRDLYRP